MPREDYEERRAARIDRLRERADRARSHGQQTLDAGDDMLKQIPFGQPILIGHHSESRDRAYRGRAFNKIDRGLDELKNAERLEARADSAEKNRAISSDDPSAPDKIRAKVEALERRHATLKAANAILRRSPRDKKTGEKMLALVALDGINEAIAHTLFEPDYMGRVGYPSYVLQNNNANIKRLKKRLEDLEAVADVETTEEEHDGFTIVENAEENRLQLIFPGKPDDQTRALLRRFGFRWSRYNQAWQRHLNGAGRAAAQMVARAIEEQDQ